MGKHIYKTCLFKDNKNCQERFIKTDLHDRIMVKKSRKRLSLDVSMRRRSEVSEEDEVSEEVMEEEDVAEEEDADEVKERNPKKRRSRRQGQLSPTKKNKKLDSASASDEEEEADEEDEVAEEVKEEELEMDSQSSPKPKFKKEKIKRKRNRSLSTTGDLNLSEIPVKRRKGDKKEAKTKSPRIDLAKQPMLQGLTSEDDLKLFLEAQAIAAKAGAAATSSPPKSPKNQKKEKLKESSAAPSTEAPGIQAIEIGCHELKTWYSAPYPEEYARLSKLYLCEFCLNYMKSPAILRRHMAKCVWRHPPGDEIYRKLKISVFEVDGKKNKMYCQNLCLLAKLFLDHKTLYFDVEPFLFYVMTESDKAGCHVIGYFSKEKNSFLNYNVSCILTMPHYMRMGYGKMLIDFSYLLSKVEDKVGSPERPLSDLGLITYQSYWKEIILSFVSNYDGHAISIKNISEDTAITPADIVATFQTLGMLKFWKGRHMVLKRQDLIDEYLEKQKKRATNFPTIDPSCLKWTPYANK